MTSVVSVITPVFGASVNYLNAAYESLLRQHLPPGWSWEWIVQEDGQTGLLDGRLAPDDRISAGHGRAGGAGVARTLALSRVTGELVKVLDADDQLTDGALARDIAALTSAHGVAWTTSRVVGLLPDGSTAGFDDDPAEGVLPQGAVFRYWNEHDFHAPVHPATLCIEADLLFAIGGWMALPASEDTGLLLAADVLSPGYFIAEAGLLYRTWPGQSTQQAAHTDPSERRARMQVLKRRTEALPALAAHRPKSCAGGVQPTTAC
jgi:glycosyltransferase involved in cell wall biosynthesis